ncbi:hypothetical protein [Actinacidiphila oryziradicis]|uniref:Uncharacterized protein n=1 Tax=Actinacidiphila oryziradicis TaxID=2571141 RepID=A0A4U0T6P5_9ACTN|nr:hypothetical protein [Actinacidiphila oryziradicis]TKA08495.1 hypothetical protein FCI23_27700 [Actinacidiphila oryziradicis]
MAEGSRREGAPGQKVGAEVVPDPDKLHAVQRDTLAAVRPSENAAPATVDDAASEPAVQSVQPAIRRFTGAKRTARVGPLRFTPGERERLQPSRRCRFDVISGARERSRPPEPCRRATVTDRKGLL